MYTHVQNVFLYYHCWELCFPYGYQATLTENSVLFLSLRENNIATAQVEGKWHFLTATLKLTVLTHIFPSCPGGQETQGRSPVPEKRLQDYSLPKARWQAGPLNFILSCSSFVSQFCKTQSLWLWSSEVQRHSFTEVAQVLQPNCMIKSFMTPGKNHTLRFCSLFPRIMQIILLLPLLKCNTKTHWVSLCFFPQTSHLLKHCLTLPRETSGMHIRDAQEIFQPCCSSFPCWWATLLEICTVAENKPPHYCCTAVSAGDITGTCPSWTLWTWCPFAEFSQNKVNVFRSKAVY